MGLPLFNSYEEVSKNSSRAKSVNPDNVRNVKDDEDSFKDITFRAWKKLEVCLRRELMLG